MRIRFAAPLSAAVLPAAAAAHTGHADSFAAAFAHPFAGIDHLLAMLIVGVWAARVAQRRDLGRAAALPLAFALSAAGGLIAGLTGVASALTEHAIVASLIVLGLAVASAGTLPWAKGAALCAAFGFFHGLAHGAELSGPAWPAAAGLIAATALLHAAGFGLARAAGARLALVGRVLGAGVGLAGLAFAVRLAA